MDINSGDVGRARAAENEPMGGGLEEERVVFSATHLDGNDLLSVVGKRGRPGPNSIMAIDMYSNRGYTDTRRKSEKPLSKLNVGSRKHFFTI